MAASVDQRACATAEARQRKRNTGGGRCAFARSVRRDRDLEQPKRD